MNVLIVVAHPDDEVLGCGALASSLAEAGTPVRACILSGEASARAGRPEDGELTADTLRAQEVLGLAPPFLGSFPNIALNTVAQLALVQFIEQAIRETQATVLFTHHPSDLNDDHAHVARACAAAARLWQRGAAVPPLDGLFHMETLSSTEWAPAHVALPFTPDTFAPVTEAHLARKLAALACYRGVMRPSPHPRSEESVLALATLRGGQCGARWAEAFSSGFRRFVPAAP